MVRGAIPLPLLYAVLNITPPMEHTIAHSQFSPKMFLLEEEERHMTNTAVKNMIRPNLISAAKAKNMLHLLYLS